MSKSKERPPLEWQVIGIYTGPDPVVPEKAPDHVKVKARRYAACQVSVASAGFDHRNNIDRVKFSYRMGWFDKTTDTFQSISNMPDERISDFIVALQRAVAEAKVLHSNAIKVPK